MKFKLELELNDDAMRTGADIERALLDVALFVSPFGVGEFGLLDRTIRDINGNTVGQWEVTS